MVAAVGQAIIFFMILILGVIVGVYLLAYAANCFLVVLQGTAAEFPSLSGFVAAVKTEMAIGEGEEEIADLPGVDLSSLSSRPTCGGLSSRAIDPSNLADVFSALNTCAAGSTK